MTKRKKIQLRIITVIKPLARVSPLLPSPLSSPKKNASILELSVPRHAVVPIEHENKILPPGCLLIKVPFFLFFFFWNGPRKINLWTECKMKNQSKPPTRPKARGYKFYGRRILASRKPILRVLLLSCVQKLRLSLSLFCLESITKDTYYLFTKWII